MKSIIDAWKRPPLLVRGGIACGLLGGLSVGAMVSPAHVGFVLGGLFGALAGGVAGIVLHKDEAKRASRTRELDDIIGVTSGSLGAPPGSIPPPSRDLHRAAVDPDLHAWHDEWLTPPPPVAT